MALLAFFRPTLRVRSLTLRLPSLRALSAIALLTALDIAAAAAALFVLLPPDISIGFEVLLPVFALSLGAGLFSSTPGGAGPFELTMLAFLPYVAADPLMGAILAWRLIYYAVPALIALIPLAFPFKVSDPRPVRSAPTSAALAHAPRAECGVGRQNGAEILETDSGRAMVVETGQTLTLLFDPLSGRGDGVVPALSAAARDRMLLPVIYKCSARLATQARQAGWRVVRIADDAVIELAGYSLDGPAFRQLRRKLRQAEKAGVSVAREEMTPALVADLARIDAQWVAEHRGARGFSMGRFCPRYLADQQVFVARQNGRVVAFATLHETTENLALDLMRHGAATPDGTMHLLIATAIASAADHGRERLTLAAIPASACKESRLATQLRDRISSGSGGPGLTRFKESFGLRRQPLYMAAPDPVTLTIAIADIARIIHRPD